MAVRQIAAGLLLAFLVSLPGLTQASSGTPTTRLATPAADGQSSSATTTPQTARPVPSETNPLNLSEEQKAKLRPILLEERQQLDALRSDSSLGQEQKIEKANDIRSGLAAKIRAILTSEQLQKLQQLQQKDNEETPSPSPTISENPQK